MKIDKTVIAKVSGLVTPINLGPKSSKYMGSMGEPQQPVKKQTPAHNKPLKAIPPVELIMACRLLLIARNRQKAAKPPARA